MACLKENIKRLIDVLLFGVPLTIWLLLKDRRTVYFIPHIGLGDYCIALGYLEAFKKANSIEHVTLIAPKNRVEVARFYPCWDSLLVLRDPLYLGLVCMGGLPIGRTIYRKAKRIVHFSFGFHLNKRYFYGNPSIRIDEEMKKLFLELPDTVERKGPVVPPINIEGIAEKYDLCFGKTVLLNPYTSGMAVQKIDDRFYVKLAGELKAKGFTVATILGSEKQEPVSGTQGIAASLAEAWYLVKWCGYVIGTRSGFFDFIRFSGCNMIGIYEPSYKLKYFFTLYLKSGNDCVREYDWQPEQEKELMKKILSDCLAWKERQAGIE